MNDNQQPPLSPREVLDHRAQALAIKHQQRLAQMITLATQQRRHNKTSQANKTNWRFLYNKPMMASAFSLVLLVTLFVISDRSKHTFLAPTNNDLPPWVMDTQTPLTLIENLEFYDWLAQQPKDLQTKLQPFPRLAFAAFNEYRLGRRHTATDITQRFSGATHHPRTVQR